MPKRGRQTKLLVSTLLVALIGAGAPWLLPPARAAQTEPTAVRFLLAVDRGDIDAALALMDDVPRITPAGGVTIAGRDAVGSYLACFPRPIVILSAEPGASGSRRFTARIHASSESFTLSFRGARGLIAWIEVEQSPPPADREDSPPEAEPEQTPQPEPERHLVSAPPRLAEHAGQLSPGRLGENRPIHSRPLGGSGGEPYRRPAPSGDRT